MKKRKLLLILLALALAFSVLVACTKKDSSEQPNQETTQPNQEKVNAYEAEDDFSNVVKFEKEPERIVSLAPNNTEILFAIGAGDKVVGVTSFDDYPEEVLAIEKVGDFSGVNIEKIIQLQPDLVIDYGSGDEEVWRRLETAGIKLVGFMPESVDEVFSVMERIGQLTGHTEEAKQKIEELTAKKDELVESVKGREPKRVFYEIWHDPLMAAGGGSFIDSLINLAGSKNVAANAEGEYPTFDIETLIEQDPQVYLSSNDLPEKTVESIKERAGFSSITAIKNNEVYLLDGNIMSRPGPRIIEALELLIEAIYKN